MGAFTQTYSFTDGTTAYGSQVSYEIAALGTSVNNIVDAQIASGANISDSKLATISTAGKVNTSALTTTSQAAGDILYNNGSGWVRLAKGTALQMLRMNAGATAPEYFTPELIRGWIVFDGTGTPSIDDSYNVDAGSFVDNGTGDYTIAWDTNFGSADYCCVGTAQDVGGTISILSINSTDGLAAGTARIRIKHDSGSAQDSALICVMAIGDQ